MSELSNQLTDKPPLQFYDPARLIGARAVPSVRDESLEVFGFHLDGTDSIIRECQAVLSDDERERAQRFRYDHDRIRYIISHGVMRNVLAQYCQHEQEQNPEQDPERDPAALRFRAGTTGKPELVDCDTPVHFNLSHAGPRAVIAISRQGPVGIDLETEVPDLAPLSIAGHYFYGEEFHAIEQAGNAAAQREAFYRYWVAKEAVLKGQGLGLGFPLDKFEIRFHHDGTVVAESFDPLQLAPGWRVTMFTCDPLWYAAVAYRSQDLKTK